MDGCVLQDEGLLHIEEARSFTHLLEVGSTEGLLDDDVQQLALDGRGVHSGRFAEADLAHRSLVDLDVLGDSFEDGLEGKGLVYLTKSVDNLARADVRPKS